MTLNDSLFQGSESKLCAGRAKECVAILLLETHVRGIRTRCYGVSKFPHVVTFPKNSPECRSRSEEILYSEFLFGAERVCHECNGTRKDIGTGYGQMSVYRDGMRTDAGLGTDGKYVIDKAHTIVLRNPPSITLTNTQHGWGQTANT